MFATDPQLRLGVSCVLCRRIGGTSSRLLVLLTVPCPPLSCSTLLTDLYWSENKELLGAVGVYKGLQG
jgi:hypothetical protein